MVFVVFGIIGINRTQQMDNHVIGDPVWPLWADVEGPQLRQKLENSHTCIARQASQSFTCTLDSYIAPPAHRPLGEHCSPGGLSRSD